MKHIVHIAGSLLLALIIWQGLVWAGNWNEALFPSPCRTWTGFYELVADGTLGQDIIASLIRFAIG